MLGFLKDVAGYFQFDVTLANLVEMAQHID